MRARLETALGASSIRYCSFGCVVMRVKWCKLILVFVGSISFSKIRCQDGWVSLQARLPLLVLVLLIYIQSCLCFSSYCGVVGMVVVCLVVGGWNSVSCFGG